MNSPAGGFLALLFLSLFVVGNCRLVLPDDPSTITSCIIPHSHDDVGWLLTPVNYYEGIVRNIYSTVVQALAENPTRRFISVEMYYFERWWTTDATDAQKNLTHALVQNGQLEFIVGGWTMEDEACTTYSANIDQMTEGHQFIFETFGVVPKYGWQIDPFGHSTNVHTQFAQMGFEATVLARIPYVEKTQMQNQKQLEFVWSPSQSNSNNQIFTHILDQYRYITAVSGLSWDTGSIPVNPVNIKYLANSIAQNIQQRAEWFATNLVMFPWGSDFLHFIATYDFSNMDKLVEEINSNPNVYGVRVAYCTLDEFFSALREMNRTWPARPASDFFTYADRPESFWSGFFSSRSALKWYTRQGEAQLRNAEFSNTVAIAQQLRSNSAETQAALTAARYLQFEQTHHDAVSGTSVPDVVANYADDLYNASSFSSPLITDAIQRMTASSGRLTFSLDPSTLQQLSSGVPIVLTAYNSLGWSTYSAFSVGVYTNVGLVVSDASSAPVPAQVIARRPSSPYPCMRNFTCGYEASPYELVFMDHVPALGFTTFTISLNSSSEFAAVQAKTRRVSVTANSNSNDTFTLQNHVYQLTFASATGMLQHEYVPMDDNITEGAYVFHPRNRSSVVASAPLRYEVIQGPLVVEVRQYFTATCESPVGVTCGLTQVVRLYNSPSSQTRADVEWAVELLHDVGPLRPNSTIALQVVSSLASAGALYTDDNCFDTIRRQRFVNYTDNIAGNFFPVTCAAMLQDASNSNSLALLTDRTHSGGSVSDGEIELLLHRRVLSTDHEGPMYINDTDRFENVRTWMLFLPASAMAPQRRRLQYLLNFAPQLAYAPNPSRYSGYARSGSALLRDLPPQLHLLSFNTRPYGTTIFRLAHVFEANESQTYSVPVSLQWSQYFNVTLQSISERSLTGVTELKSMNRAVWYSPAGPTPASFPPSLSFNGSDPVFTLSPHDVRTYYVQ